MPGGGLTPPCDPGSRIPIVNQHATEQQELDQVANPNNALPFITALCVLA